MTRLVAKSGDDNDTARADVRARAGEPLAQSEALDVAVSTCNPSVRALSRAADAAVRVRRGAPLPSSASPNRSFELMAWQSPQQAFHFAASQLWVPPDALSTHLAHLVPTRTGTGLQVHALTSERVLLRTGRNSTWSIVCGPTPAGFVRAPLASARVLRGRVGPN